jgi:hypothetical protein
MTARRIRFAVATAGVLAAVGAISVASAASPKNASNNVVLSGYDKNQCKDGGWHNFKNADGSEMFKNQGDCVSFFATGGKNQPANAH